MHCPTEICIALFFGYFFRVGFQNSVHISDSMEQNPKEIDSHVDSGDIVHLLWDPEVQYCGHKSAPLDPAANQIYTLHPYPLSPRPILILFSSLSFMWSLSLEYFSHIIVN
jgi:hypothetical protein